MSQKKETGAKTTSGTNRKNKPFKKMNQMNRPQTNHTFLPNY